MGVLQDLQTIFPERQVKVRNVIEYWFMDVDKQYTKSPQSKFRSTFKHKCTQRYGVQPTSLAPAQTVLPARQIHNATTFYDVPCCLLSQSPLERVCVEMDQCRMSFVRGKRRIVMHGLEYKPTGRLEYA